MFCDELLRCDNSVEVVRLVGGHHLAFLASVSFLVNELSSIDLDHDTSGIVELLQELPLAHVHVFICNKV